MAIALGFGQGNKDTPMAGSTGGGSIAPKLQLNGQGQLTTDGSGGFLNYLTGLMKPAAGAGAAAAGQAAAPAASTAGALSGGGL